MYPYSKVAAILVALIGLSVALQAAHLWWKASNVKTHILIASIEDVPDWHLLAVWSARYGSPTLNTRTGKWTGSDYRYRYKTRLADVIGSVGSGAPRESFRV